MALSVYLDGQNIPQVIYNNEEDFETLIIENSVTIFGKTSIYIDVKHRLASSSLGITIPDGILLDLSDPDCPEFYLVEVELQTHDFFRHIFPQITKFFAFYQKPSEHLKLTERIFSIFKQDNEISNKLKSIIGSKEIYKFLKDTIENSHNILIIIDGPKPEFDEIMNTYMDTWGKMVKVQIVNHFKDENHNILTSNPPFQELELINPVATSTEEGISETLQFTEEFHLKDINENVKDVYDRLKKTFLKIKNTIKFNPTRIYIGVYDTRNIAYIQFRKKKVHMIVLLPEKEVKSSIKSQYHEVRSLSEDAQRTWGGKNPNCSVDIFDIKDFDEIEKLLQQVVSRNEEK
jgi:predicted transport protein